MRSSSFPPHVYCPTCHRWHTALVCQYCKNPSSEYQHFLSITKPRAEVIDIFSREKREEL